mgnify:CR=1 FL=1
MKAALFVGGWEGHTPTHFADWYEDLLRNNGFEVDVYDTLEPLERPDDLADLDLITPIWSSARCCRVPIAFRSSSPSSRWATKKVLQPAA